jgi:hypothetical protein
VSASQQKRRKSRAAPGKPRAVIVMEPLEFEWKDVPPTVAHRPDQ